MKFELKDKFRTQGDLMIEIVGIRPGAQGVQMLSLNENYYEIVINGHRSMMSEGVLDKLISNIKEDVIDIAKRINISEANDEEIIEDEKETDKKQTSEISKNEIKIKRGRKSKGE